MEKEILNKLEEINQRLDKLENEIKYIKESSTNMNEHISFIETVYDTIKYPFYFIINKIKPIENIPIKEKRLLIKK